MADEVDAAGVPPVVQPGADVGELLERSLADVKRLVDDLRGAEERLRRQNEELVAARLIAEADRERYHNLFEFAPHGYVVTDEAGRILQANRAAADLLGAAPGSLAGRSMLDLLDPGERRRARRRLSSLSRSRRIEDWSLRLQALDGSTFEASVTVDSMRGDALPTAELRWLLRDLTDHHRNEQRLAALTDQLEQRVEARTRELLELATTRAELEQRAEPADSSSRALKQLRDLQTITDAMLRGADLDELLHEMLHAVRDAIGSDTATILLVTPDGANLAVRAEVGGVEEVVGEVRVPLGQGVAGTIAARRTPMIIEDVRAAGAHSRFLRETIHSLVGVPILVGTEVIGVLHSGTHARHLFSEDDQRLLELVAERAGTAIERARLYEAERAARRDAEIAAMRLGFVSEASQLLAGSLSTPEAFENLGRLAVAFLTDVCLIDVIQDDGALRRVAAVHADPQKQPLARRLQEEFAPDPHGPHPAVAVMHSGRARFASEMDDEFLRATSRNDEHYRLIKELGFRSYISAPLVARGAILGSLTLVSTTPGREYGADDVPLVEDLGRRAGVAIDVARLLDAEQRARRTAERAAARTAVLQAVTASLSEAAAPSDVARVVRDRVLPAVGASAGSIAVVSADGRSLELIAAEGYRADILENWREIPIDAPVPLAEAVRRGEPVFAGSREEIRREYPHLEGAADPSHLALAAFPMLSHGRVVGAVGFSYPREREFSDDDRALKLAIARQCGQTLERVHLYESERRAEEEARAAQRRLAFLAEASRALAETLDLEETLATVAALVVPVLADLCLIDMLDEDGSLRRVGAAAARPAHESLVEELREHPPALASDDPAALAVRTGRRQLVTRLDAADARGRPRGRAVQRLLSARPHGILSLPLQARGRRLGAITFVSLTAGLTYDDDEVAFAEAIAQRAAVAADNARLYSERDHIARTLQRSLLPPGLPEIPGIAIAARYLPAGEGNEVGGDFYDVFETGRGSWAVAVGDVCGKGAEAAAVTGLARHTLRAAALNEQRPSAVLRLLNEAMLKRETDDRFCTVCYVRVRPDVAGARLTVCCAGHPLPLVVRRDGRVESAGRPGSLLGVFAEPELFDAAVDLAPGDALVVFTDGVIEERRSEVFFGLRRLADAVSAVAGAPAGEIADAVQGAVQDFNPAPSGDDVTVLVVGVSPPG